MRVLILGIGDAFTALRFGSSALIDGPEGYLLLDAPDPIHRVLREGAWEASWSVGAIDINSVLLTHLHGDHANGLESLGFHRFLARATGVAPDAPNPVIHTHAEAGKRLWQKLAPAMDAPMRGGDQRARLEDFFTLGLFEPHMPFQACGLTIEARFGHHPIPTVGFKITDPSTGKTLGWSGDTDFQPEHVEWLSSADVIIHECNLGPAHTSIDELNRLPDEIRTKMKLIHTPDDFDASCTDIELAAQGEVITL